MKTRTLITALVVASALTGCRGSDPTKDRLSSAPSPTGTATDSAGTCTPTGKGTTDLTKKPVAAYGTGAEPTVTTLYDEVCGTGAEAVAGSNVEVKYVGLLFKGGTEFDSSWKRGDTFPFQIGGQVVAGFSKGALGMKVGGRREVVIPSVDGYGPGGNGPIPGGATLIFLIDLVKVS